MEGQKDDLRDLILDVAKQVHTISLRQSEFAARLEHVQEENHANVHKLFTTLNETVGVRASPGFGPVGGRSSIPPDSSRNAGEWHQELSPPSQASPSITASPPGSVPSSLPDPLIVPPSNNREDSKSSSLSASVTSAHSNSIFPNRIILTTYPGQVGIRPAKLNWGHPDPNIRGYIIASRHTSSIKIRNAIGAYGGSYSVYRALSVASGQLPPSHMPDLHDTEPPVNFPSQPAWGDPDKIVSLDPFGHLPQTVYKSALSEGIDIRPSIAVTKAHMRVPEIEASVKNGTLAVDGKIVTTQLGDVKVVKAAVEPVWHLPGVAHRFGVDEKILRRALFEETGGMYPELITRSDLKVFFPPIGGLTVYIFGPVEHISDPSKKLTLRVHDECNGSDVFGSDICTCRPYLIYGIEQCIKAAQEGGSGVIVYFRKEGRALGEVTKYLVYNARKRGGDLASAYFQRTENVAGVKDARFQALMPDVLHWLGITRIDRLMSMSNMKYDAIVGSGIEIVERVPIPDDLIPTDSRVEIDAKIAAGYFSEKKVSVRDLEEVRGRNWEWDELQH